MSLWTGSYQRLLGTFNPLTRQNVRFGSKADICSAKRHVRFVQIADITGENGRYVTRRSGCENECANSSKDGGLLVAGQCDHLKSSPLAPLPAGNICSTAPSHSFSAGSFSPARWSVASFTKAAERESFSSFR